MHNNHRLLIIGTLKKKWVSFSLIQGQRGVWKLINENWASYPLKSKKLFELQSISFQSMLVIPLQFLRAVSPFLHIFESDSRFSLDLEILPVGQIYFEFQTEITWTPVDQDFLHFSYILTVELQSPIVIVLMELPVIALIFINRE